MNFAQNFFLSEVLENVPEEAPLPAMAKRTRSSQHVKLASTAAFVAATALSVGLLTTAIPANALNTRSTEVRAETEAGSTKGEVLVVQRTKPNGLLKAALEIWMRPRSEKPVDRERASALLDAIAASTRG